MHFVSIVVPRGDDCFKVGMSSIDRHRNYRFPVVIVHANFLAVPCAPKDHELFRKFGVVRVFEKVEPPPPVPCTILKHVLWIDSPYVVEDFVHITLQTLRPYPKRPVQVESTSVIQNHCHDISSELQSCPCGRTLVEFLTLTFDSFSVTHQRSNLSRGQK